MGCKQDLFLSRKYCKGIYFASASGNESKKGRMEEQRTSIKVSPTATIKEEVMGDSKKGTPSSVRHSFLPTSDTVFAIDRRKLVGKVTVINDVAVKLRLLDSTSVYIPFNELKKIVYENGIVENASELKAKPITTYQPKPTYTPKPTQTPEPSNDKKLTKRKAFFMVLGMVTLLIFGAVLITEFGILGLLMVGLVLLGLIGLGSDNQGFRNFMINFMAAIGVIVAGFVLSMILLGLIIVLSL